MEDPNITGQNVEEDENKFEVDEEGEESEGEGSEGEESEGEEGDEPEVEGGEESEGEEGGEEIEEVYEEDRDEIAEAYDEEADKGGIDLMNEDEIKDRRRDRGLDYFEKDDFIVDEYESEEDNGGDARLDAEVRLLTDALAESVNLDVLLLLREYSFFPYAVLKKLLPQGKQMARDYKIEQQEKEKKAKEMRERKALEREQKALERMQRYNKLPDELKRSAQNPFLEKTEKEFPEISRKAKEQWAYLTIALATRQPSYKGDNPYYRNLLRLLTLSDGEKAVSMKSLMKFLISIAPRYIEMKQEFAKTPEFIAIKNAIRTLVVNYPNIEIKTKEAQLYVDQLYNKLGSHGLGAKEKSKDKQLQYMTMEKPNILQLMNAFFQNCLDEPHLPFSKNYRKLTENMIETLKKEQVNMPDINDVIYAVEMPSAAFVRGVFEQEFSQIKNMDDFIKRSLETKHTS